MGACGGKWEKVGVNPRSSMFTGTTDLNLDDKGRMAIPARYRDVLLVQCEGRLVVTVDPTTPHNPCLLVYPEPEWMPIAQKLERMSSLTNPQLRALPRHLLGNAEPVEMDKSGRILLSSNLRSRGGLEKEVLLVGQGRKFELWDKTRYDALMSAPIDFALLQSAPELEGFSL